MTARWYFLLNDFVGSSPLPLKAGKWKVASSGYLFWGLDADAIHPPTVGLDADAAHLLMSLLLAFVIVHRCLLDARLIVFYISFIGLCWWWWWRPWCTCLALELTTSFPSSCLSAFEASQRCTHPSNASADLGPQRTCTWPPNFKSSRFKSDNPNFSGD